MKRCVALLVLLLSAGLLLAGCSTARSYTSITTHVDQRVTEDDPSVLRAETYQELVSSILHFVSEGEESGTIRLYQYTGDVESDLEAACQEVLEEDPLGAFALDSIEHEYSRIVSYYECEFTLVYRRTAEEIDAVTTAASTVSFREQLQQAMDTFSERLAIRTSLSVSEESVLEMVTEYYYETPSLAVGFPSVTVNFFGGEDSTQKIVEIEFGYTQGSDACAEMQAELLNTAYTLLTELNAASADPAGLWSVYRTLAEYPIYSGISTSSAYRFLVNQKGSQQGASLSLLLLCQLMNFDAYYVEGSSIEYEDHSWVMVQIGDVWCHMDLSLADDQNSFLHSDDEMTALGYVWDQEAYPACEGLSASEAAESADQSGQEDTAADDAAAGDAALSEPAD